MVINNNFRNELRIKYLKTLGKINNTNEFIKFFDDSEDYIEEILNGKTNAKKEIIKDIKEVLIDRREIALSKQL